MNAKTLLSMAVLVAVGALAGCGGSGGGGSAQVGGAKVTGVITTLNTAPTSGMAVGVASGGNTTIEVNNVTYTLDDSVDVEVEDGIGDESDLAEGQVVTLSTATDSDGTNLATAIAYEDELEGVVFSANIAGGSLVVMGQTVLVTGTTIFESNDPAVPDLASVATGNVVEVSGHPTVDGIHATRIEVKHADYTAYDGEFELKGTITDANDTAVIIGGQPIDIQSADVGDMPTDKAQWLGLYVEVKTTQVDPGAGTITASKLEVEDHESDGVDGDEAEMEGVLAYSNGTASINGRPVEVSAAVTPELLASLDGQLVKVEGHYEGDVLVVDQVQLAN